MPLSIWLASAWCAFRELAKENIGLIAAGVAFYGFLALLPMLGAIVLSYGLIADRSTVLDNVRSLTAIMPPDAAKIVGEHLLDIVGTSGGKKGLGLFLALAVALFGARNGAGSIITALNVAYEEEEKRSFIRVNLVALTMTVCAVIAVLVAAFAIAMVARIQALLPDLHNAVLTAGRILAYGILVVGGAAGTASLYRYGPSRRKARWVWISPGSLFASTAWFFLTLGFGLYVANFGNYDVTYGSLGAVVVLLTWFYLTSYVLIFGAKLNFEFERESRGDATKGDHHPGESEVVSDVGAKSTFHTHPAYRHHPGTTKAISCSEISYVGMISVALLAAWLLARKTDEPQAKLVDLWRATAASGRMKLPSRPTRLFRKRFQGR